MLFLLGFLCTAYVVVVVALRRERRSARDAAVAAALPTLPADDQPPTAAVGWPPEGLDLPVYVADGFAAIDAYLSEGFAT